MPSRKIKKGSYWFGTIFDGVFLEDWKEGRRKEEFQFRKRRLDGVIIPCGILFLESITKYSFFSSWLFFSISRVLEVFYFLGINEILVN